MAKRKSCFSIASLLKDTTKQLRKLNGFRTPHIGFFVAMLMGLKSLFDSDQNLPLRSNNAFKMQDAHLAETWQSLSPIRTEHQQRQREDQQFEGGENFDYYVDKEPRGEPRRQRLHLQHRSGKTHNDKRVGAHDMPHHLINGGDFGFLEGIPENRREVWQGHPLTGHICAVQFDHSAHRTLNALSRPSVICKHLCAPK